MTSTDNDDQIIDLGPRASYQEAISDIKRGLVAWRAWNLLAWYEIKHSYRGSLLGPFWISLTMGIFIGTVGLLYSQVLGANAADYIPWLASGFVTWSLISNLMNEGAQVYTKSGAFSTQMRLPYSFFSYKLCAKQILMFAHNIVIMIPVIYFLDVPFGVATFGFVLGAMVIVYAGFWISIILGLLCIRFRDIPNIISSLVQVSFFLTPIIWQPARVGSRTFVIDYNPFYHFLELVRAPLLGTLPNLTNVAVCLGLSALLTVIGTFLFRRYRNRIPYWI